MDNCKHKDITGAILAGGKGSRMGGKDKGLIKLNGRPLIEQVLEQIRPQVREVIINANRHLDDYQKYGLRVVKDTRAGLPGPLAGIAAALEAARTPFIAAVPCDGPCLPPDLVSRLYASLTAADADLAVVHSLRLQPVFCLGKKELLQSLCEFLDAGGRKIDEWHRQVNVVQVDFDDIPEAFININTPEDLETSTFQK